MVVMFPVTAADRAKFRRERNRNCRRKRLYRATITTRVPSKWRIVDLESGRSYPLNCLFPEIVKG